jgi:hypothetical protein
MLARTGANLPAISHPKDMSLAGAHKWLSKQSTRDFATFWQATPPRAILLPAPIPQAPRILSLSRPVLARILAARSGHGDFSTYHNRFNHTSAVVQCRCGAHTAPLHFFHCRIATKKEMLQTSRGQRLAPNELISTDGGAAIFGACCKQPTTSLLPPAQTHLPPTPPL